MRPVQETLRAVYSIQWQAHRHQKRDNFTFDQLLVLHVFFAGFGHAAEQRPVAPSNDCRPLQRFAAAALTSQDCLFCIYTPCCDRPIAFPLIAEVKSCNHRETYTRQAHNAKVRTVEGFTTSEHVATGFEDVIFQSFCPWAAV